MAALQDVPVQTFEEFVRSALPRLVRFARWVSGPGGDAEDLVQDALERTGLRWRAVVARDGDPEAYVRRAIVNGHVSRWRSRRKEHLVDAVPDVRSAHAADDPRHGPVWQVLHALPRAQRAVVALRFFEDLSVADTAAVLGVGEGTVKSYTHRALSTMRAGLTAGGEPDEAVLARARGEALAGAGGLTVAPGAVERISDGVAGRARRRTALVVAAITVVVAAAGAGLAWWSRGGVDRLQPVVPAPPAPSATAPSATILSPDASAVVPVAPDVPVSPTPAASGEPGDPGPTGTADPATVPDIDLTAYRFAVEDSPSAGDDLQRSPELGTPWVMDPCRPTAYPLDARREAFAGASSYVGDAGQAVQLARYPDEATASEVVAGFSRVVAACGRTGEPEPAIGSGLTQWRTFTPPSLGDEALGFQSAEYIADFDVPGAGYVVIREGTYVLLVTAGSEYAGDPDEDTYRVDRATGYAQAEFALLQAALDAA